jgi:hypothetical protein
MNVVALTQKLTEMELSNIRNENQRSIGWANNMMCAASCTIPD